MENLYRDFIPFSNVVFLTVWCGLNKSISDGVAHSMSSHITWPLTLSLSTPWMHAHLGTIVCEFGHDPAIWRREEAICAKSLETDGQTDGHRKPCHGISSWNELIKMVGLRRRHCMSPSGCWEPPCMRLHCTDL